MSEHLHQWHDVPEGSICISTHREGGQAKREIHKHIVNDQIEAGTISRYRHMVEQANIEAIEREMLAIATEVE